MEPQINAINTHIKTMINLAVQTQVSPKSNKYYEKLVKKSLLLLLKYKSSLKNKNYVLDGDLSKFLQYLLDRKY